MINVKTRLYFFKKDHLGLKVTYTKYLAGFFLIQLSQNIGPLQSVLSKISTSYAWEGNSTY